MIDLHNHMLPFLDDGASDWESSIQMAHIAVDDGIRAVVCTPHWVQGCYENSRAVILDAVERLQKRLDERSIPLKVYPGAELHLDFDLPQRLADGQLATLNDTGRYALIELPVDIVPFNLKTLFWELIALNITPILSHPERNLALTRNPMRLFHWVEMGVLTQVTGASLMGRFGPQIQKFTIDLLEHDLVHVIASDAHSPKMRAPRLASARKEVSRLMGASTAKELFITNPRAILSGNSITTRPPRPLEPGSESSTIRKIFSIFGLDSR